MVLIIKNVPAHVRIGTELNIVASPKSTVSTPRISTVTGRMSEIIFFKNLIPNPFSKEEEAKVFSSTGGFVDVEIREMNFILIVASFCFSCQVIKYFIH